MTHSQAIAAAERHAAKVKNPKTREALRKVIEAAKRPTDEGSPVTAYLFTTFPKSRAS